MKHNINVLFILFVLVYYSLNACGQDSLKVQPKNIIYANAGLGYWATASANYERMLVSTNNKFYINYYIRASIGAAATVGGDEGGYGSLSLQGVMGAQKNHLEISVGLNALYDKLAYENEASYYPSGISRWDYTYWFPGISVGYRYQKPNEGFIFRTGIGIPDGVYISCGFAF